MKNYNIHIRNGEIHKTKNSGICIIIKYNNSRDVTIKFEDGTIIENIKYSSLKSGYIKNPNNQNIYTNGYIGQGKYSSKNNIKIYKVWNHMLERCYDSKYQLIRPTYIGCTVDKRWYNFQVFAEWYENNYIEGFVLDKDILIKGNRIYSPETCCFVPSEINNLFTKCNKSRGNLPIGVNKNGNNYQAIYSRFNKSYPLGTFKTIQEAFDVYKQHKESYIKEVADIWKDKVTPKVYQALYNYQVEITD